ncbi:MAG TPA: hypothetical protein VF258_06755, partial [Luteolibacter sp.]
GRDAEAIPWMAGHTRNPWPAKIVWVQDDITHDRFYWLQIPQDSAKVGAKITATVSGNEISLEGDVPQGLTLHLADALVNLDADVIVEINGVRKFTGRIPRTEATISSALKSSPDAVRCPTASLRLAD